MKRGGGRGGEAVFSTLRFECPHCHRPLKRITVELFGKPMEVPCWESCGCEESKWDGLDVRDSERDWYRAGIPERYIRAECDVAGYPRLVADGKSLYIHGPYGSGKTRFASCMAKALMNMGE